MSLFVIIFIFVPLVSSYGTCDDPYHIEKYTTATSDSLRDSKHIFNIFVHLNEQQTEHFVSGMCANGMKVELPDSCFKIHAPQTWQHDEGLLSVELYEKVFSEKWENVFHQKSEFEFDAFFDFGIAFFVFSLDEYIAQWSEHSEIEYFGIEWLHKMDGVDLEISSPLFESNTFYSILVHSPSSSQIYEFISFARPSQPNYDKVRWKKSDFMRATFSLQKPWQREDLSPISPIRISRATTNVAAMTDFYVDVMEAHIIYSEQGSNHFNADFVETRSVFLVAANTQIELQFIERSSFYTFGDFKLAQYESLLIESHDEIITSPFCGIDRWFDNHFGVSAWSNFGFMDRVIAKLNARNEQKYRVYQSLYAHSSPAGKANLDKYGADTTFIFFFFDPSGQCIQMMGYFVATQFAMSVPQWNAQWCYTRCPHGLMDGKVNPQHIYSINAQSDRRFDFDIELDLKQGQIDKLLLVIGCCFFLMIVLLFKCSRNQNDYVKL